MQYRVILVRHLYGEVLVEAKSKKQAEEQAQEMIDNDEIGCHAEVHNEETEIIEVIK